MKHLSWLPPKSELSPDFRENERSALKWTIGSLAVAAGGGVVAAEVNPLAGTVIALSSFALAYNAQKINIMNGRRYPHDSWPPPSPEEPGQQG